MTAVCGKYVAVPLVAAAAVGSTDAVAALVAAGASVQACGTDALVAATKQRSVGVVKQLLALGADMAGVSHGGVLESVLHAAADVKTPADMEVGVRGEPRVCLPLRVRLCASAPLCLCASVPLYLCAFCTSVPLCPCASVFRCRGEK